MRLNPLIQLTLVKTREFIREPEALFWVFAFPLLMALALGVAFRSGDREQIRVGIELGEGAPGLQAALHDADGLRVEMLSQEQARDYLRRGQVDVVIVPGDPLTYAFDPTRPQSRLAQLEVDNAVQRAAGRKDVRSAAVREVTERGSRYIDFLIPGLLGMNLMGTGIWGVGFAIVSARSKRLLKRLIATPMRRSDFLLGQVSGRMVFLIPEVALLLGFSRLAFKVENHGSWVTLTLVCLIGALVFGGIGLLVASRAKTIEGVSGLMNVVMLPMWICSGTFFSTSRFPDVMQPLVQLLPLTAVNDALRAVMVDGASLASQSGELLIAGGWGVGAFAAALAIFRWQ